LGEVVLFINIQPDAAYGTQAEGYQGIVERVSDNLADCLAHYQQQSVQIPTLINLACDGEQAGGIVLQLLPRTTEEEHETVDNDLFPRLKILTKTLDGLVLGDNLYISDAKEGKAILANTEYLSTLFNSGVIFLPINSSFLIPHNLSKDSLTNVTLKFSS
jgi:hypothetical protein